MAQAGYTPILLYGSSTAAAVPGAANLTSSSNGAELALNYADGRLYYKDAAGTPAVQIVGARLGANVTTGGTIAAGFGSATGVTGTGSFVFSTSPALTTPNLGTPSAVTLTNATGLPLTTGVTGVLPIANGGTNSTATATAGGVAYGTGSAYAFTAAGTAGYLLQSNGSSAPTWVAAPSSGVTTISFGSTGLTPSTATSGAVSVAGTLAVGNGGTGTTSLTANNVILGNGSSAVQFVAPGTSGNVLTSNGTTWASAAAPSSFPLTLVNSTTISSSTSFYEQTGLGSYTDYFFYIYFLNCTSGNPGGYLIKDNATTADWTNNSGGRAFTDAYGSSGAWTISNDQNNRIWINSGNIQYLCMQMSGFGTRYFRWNDFYQSQNEYYGFQQGYTDAGAGRTITGFRLTFPGAATTGIIQLYRRG